MYIRHRFHNDKDLEKWFSQRFCKRWKRLLSMYQGLKKHVDMACALRATSLAMAFCGAVEDGNVAMAQSFDDVLHGYGDCFVVDDVPMVIGDDNVDAGLLMWDIAILMLEEHPELIPACQFGWDIVGRHVRWAYQVMQNEETVPVAQDTVKHPVAEVAEFVEIPATPVEMKFAPETVDVEKIRRDAVVESLLRYLRDNADQPYDVRRQTKLMVMDLIFQQGIEVDADVRREISRYDAANGVKMDAILDLLGNVTTVNLIDNKGTYIAKKINDYGHSIS